MADENISDLEYIQRRFDGLQRELREALQTMELRDDQREASHQALVGTLTSQMVSVGTQVDERIAEFEARLDEKLAALEARLVDRLAPRGQG